MFSVEQQSANPMLSLISSTWMLLIHNSYGNCKGGLSFSQY